MLNNEIGIFKFKKGKIILVLLGFVVALILMCSGNEANATETYTENEVTATLSDDGTLTISGNGKITESLIRNFDYQRTIKNVNINSGITSIGRMAFSYCDKLESIDIPESVTSIGEMAFRECRSLTSIEIPDSVTDIRGYMLFYNCTNLESVKMSNNITSLGAEIFENCTSLKSFIIPDNVTNISYDAFKSCKSLKSIKIPEAVNLMADTFDGCTSLMSIEVSENNANYCSEDGILFNKEKSRLIRYPQGKEGTEYKAPNSVKYLSNRVFSGCSKLTKIEIPESIEIIGNSAFYRCTSLTNIEIPSGVTSIGDYAFYSCSKVESITIPKKVTTIYKTAFYKCSKLENINVDLDNATYSSENGVLFNKDKTKLMLCPSGKKQETYSVPEGVIDLEELAFLDCIYLKEIIIGEGITIINNGTFSGCTNLENVNIPDGVTSIGDQAFLYCYNLKNVVLPNSVTSIGKTVFAYCNNLENIEIPESVTSIGSSAFNNSVMRQYIENKTIEQVQIPNIIKRAITSDDLLYSENIVLKNCSFDDSKSNIILDLDKISEGATIEVKEGLLKGLEYIITLESIDISYDENSNVFARMSDDILYISGTGKMKDNPNFTELFNSKQVKKVVIEDGVTNIGKSAFKKFNNLISVEIPSSVTSIGNEAFYECSSLVSIEIPEGVTRMGYSIFEYCSSLTNITIPSTVTSIENSAFYECSSLVSIEIPSTVTSIGNGAFGYCSSLTNIEIPSSVISLGGLPFVHCDSLKNINVDTNNKNYSSENGILFNKDKTKLIAYPEGKEEVSYYIPESVTTIGGDAFNGTSLIKIKVPKSVIAIENNAFLNNDNLIIYCYLDSAAESYAKNKNIQYKIINYELEEKIVKKVTPKTTGAKFIEEAKNLIWGNEYKIYDKDGQEMEEDAIVTTASKLKVDNEEYEIAVIGDLNADGKLNGLDIVRMRYNRIGQLDLEGAYEKAADLNRDGTLDGRDLVRMRLINVGLLSYAE